MIGKNEENCGLKTIINLIIINLIINILTFMLYDIDITYIYIFVILTVFSSF